MPGYFGPKKPKTSRLMEVQDHDATGDDATTGEPDDHEKQSRKMIPTHVSNSKNVDDDTDDTFDTKQEIYMAIHINHDRPGDIVLGAAIIDSEANILHCLARTVGWAGDLHFLLSLLTQLNPKAKILLSSKMQETYLEIVKMVCSETVPAIGGSDCTNGKVALLPSSYFEYQASCRRLATVFGGPSALGSYVDLANQATVQAAGAILAFAQSTIPDLQPLTIDMFDLGSFMVMDAGSSRALDISKLEEHPSVIRGRGTPKEGFSLLSLLDRSKSKWGSRTLRRWLARPLTNAKEIEERHEAVDYLLQKMGSEGIVKITQHLAKVGDVHRSLLRLKSCEASVKDWNTISDSLLHMQLVLSELASLRDDLDGVPFPSILEHIERANHSPGLSDVARSLMSLDWQKLQTDMNSPNARVVPVDGVDSDLDELRNRLSRLPDLLTAETLALMNDKVNVRCIPVIGFVLAVEHQDEELGPDIELLFEAAIQSDDSRIIRYCKNHRMRELDAQVGDIPGLLRDLEDEYVRGVENVVLAFEIDIFAIAHRCSELDTLLCFAEVAHDFNYVRPQMSEDAVVFIESARHPLLERVLDGAFISSDIAVTSGCLIITGPNYSGKSVVLKTIALCQVLSQIGCFVPAKRATIGVVDRVFTRIASMESMGSAGSHRESSFTLDIRQVVTMLRCCTPKSLVLIDEFGKGTNSLDGSALLAAVIHYLSHGGVGRPPRCVFATHLIEIFDAGLLNPVDARLAEMAVEFEDGLPIPLFRLEASTFSATKESYGVACAKNSGMPQSVIDRATELVSRLESGRPLFVANERRRIERGRLVNEVVNQFLQVEGEDSCTDGMITTLFSQVERMPVL